MKKQSKLLLSLVLGVIFLTVVVIFTISPSEEDPTKSKTIDRNLLVGNWLRTDAGYRILISKVNNDGSLGANYFNPNPINVGRASWQENSGNLKIIVELRDVNYPGSTYTLSYLADRDILAGEYYQAVEGLTFYVEFARIK